MTERYTDSQEGDEEAGRSSNEEEGDDNRGMSADFQFDANVLQDQRILDADDLIRFDPGPPSDYLNTDDICEDPMYASGGVQSGNWQFQNPNGIKKKIKRIIQRELNREDMMSEEETSKVIS